MKLTAIPRSSGGGPGHARSAGPVCAWHVCGVGTLLQRLHGGRGLQGHQALPLQVEDMLLLKLLHLDELLLEGQLLRA